MNSLSDVLSFFESLFPPRFALPDDRTGLQIHGKRQYIQRVLVALELHPDLLLKIIHNQIDFLFLHHPPLWEPLKKLSIDDPWCDMLCTLYQEGISVLAFHTSLDTMAGGLADQWIDLLSLAGDRTPLFPYPPSSGLKVVTFLPPSHLKTVTDALFAIGAGQMEGYTHCYFQVPGTGTFLPKSESPPFIGEPEQEQNVEEVRIEVTIPDVTKVAEVIRVIREIHPYEVPVTDIYPLYPIDPPTTGIGRLVTLSSPLSLSDLCSRVQHLLPSLPIHPITSSSPHDPLSTIALCPGGGSGVLNEVITQKADLFLTGDLTHHHIEKLKLYSCTYLPVPHGPGERLALENLFPRMKREAIKSLPGVEFSFETEG
ncbi:MAG: Nif3-like dinuclear metal center hexameric protein [Candidatus Atribacteria bacterium]|nr:Nif3-like dinuclear metal center hexameric protein [Candidatus Atribacteria bacterium]